MKNHPTIGFIGAGNMAHALISGLINNGFSAQNIKISDTNKGLLAKRQSQFNLQIAPTNADLARSSQVIVLAVKPQVLPAVCQDLQNSLKHKPLIISIAAGARIIDIDRWLGGKSAIVRSMPNTPALLGQGMSALFANNLTNKTQQKSATQILKSVGEVIWFTDEKMLDVVTALSGSGPAYFFLLLESMTRAGVSLGLEAATAQKLSIQTAFGASMMARDSNDSPQTLRQNITSANGTTEAGIESLQEQNFESIISHAIRVAFDRSREIGNEIGDEIGDE